MSDQCTREAIVTPTIYHVYSKSNPSVPCLNNKQSEMSVCTAVTGKSILIKSTSSQIGAKKMVRFSQIIQINKVEESQLCYMVRSKRRTNCCTIF